MCFFRVFFALNMTRLFIDGRKCEKFSHHSLEDSQSGVATISISNIDDVRIGKQSRVIRGRKSHGCHMACRANTV